jgi:WD40 repeat protein
MKCLEKDRNRRYDTANSLALDLERYLKDEPVQACPPSAAYRVRKFTRRNRVSLLTTGAIASILVVATVVSAWQAYRATRAERRARVSAAELAYDKSQLLGEQGDADLALLWLTRSLKLAPPDAAELQTAIRTNLGAWRRRVNSLRQVLPHDGTVITLAFGRDGRIVTGDVASGDEALVAHSWDPTSGAGLGALRIAHERPGPSGGPLLTLATLSQSNSCLVGFDDGTVQLIDLTTGKAVWKHLEPGACPRTAAFTSDDARVLVGFGIDQPGARPAGRVRLLDTADGKCLGPPVVLERPVYAVAFHPDGKSYVTECGIWGDAQEPAAARFWDLNGREHRAPLPHTCLAPAAAFSPDGTRLLTGHWDYKAWIWDLGGADKPVLLQNEGPVITAAFSPDGRTVLTGAFDGSVRLWDVSGRPLGSPLRQGHMVHAARFSPDGKRLLVGSRGNTARLWDLAAIDGDGRDEPNAASTVPLAVSPDGQTILAPDAGNAVVLRDAATGQVVGRPLPHQRPVQFGGTSVLPGQRQACSSDRRRALTVDADGVARLWDAQTGEVTARLELESPSVFTAAAFSRDGKLAVTGSFHWTAHAWDAETGRHLRAFEHEKDGPVFQVTFSPDGRTMLTGGADRSVRFWDLATGTELTPPLMHHAAVIALALSPDGRTIVTGDTDQNVRLWDLAARRGLLHLAGHRGGVNDAAFSPDGRLVVTGSHDRTARLWDVASGKPIGPPLPHRGPVVRVGFGRDGRTILTVTHDQKTRSWPVPEAMTGTPDQIEGWARVVTGMELDVNGGVRILDAATWKKARVGLAGTGLLDR